MKKAIVSILILVFIFLFSFTFRSNKLLKAAPPENFQSTQVIGIGLDGPSGFDIAPDGRIFILERTGKIHVYKEGLGLLAIPFAELPSSSSGDRGLIGIAFDPDYDTNHWVYFYYTGLDLFNYLVRFDASEDIGQDMVTLYQTTSPSFELHVGGTIRFGNDEKIYFSVGDNGYAPNAQDLSNPHGKILRLNKDGTVPDDNPFYGQPDVLPEIWAYGLRNPFRFQFDSLTGRMYAGDVGDANVEEINYVEEGGNYGWPICEGSCYNPLYEDPIYEWLHDGGSAAAVGGPVYHGSLFPSEYDGNLFVGDYAKGFIRRLVLEEHLHEGDVHMHVSSVFDFDSVAGSVVDMKVAEDGSLYYITFIPGALYRVTYSENSVVPVAVATSDVSGGGDPLTVNFSSDGSYDPNGDTLTYNWDFGDGTTSSEENPSKTYEDKGVYTVDLMVSDGVNSANSVPLIIQVGIPPTLHIGWPLDGSKYKAGDTIFYSTSGLDAGGFDLGDDAFTTEVVFHHGTHTHPFLGPLEDTNSGQFVIPKSGEPSDDTWYNLSFTGVDVNGLSKTESVNIYPKKSEIIYKTSPEGLEITLDGIPTPTTQTITQVQGYERELLAPIFQKKDGEHYLFSNWSDSGALKHIISTPEIDTTYQATFEVAAPFVAEYFDNIDLSGLPILTRNDKWIDFEWGEDGPGEGVPIDYFSVRWIANQHFEEGEYIFQTTSDDGVRLWVDGVLIVDKWINQGPTIYYASTSLDEGDHEIRMEYYENDGGAVAKLSVELAPNQPSADPQSNGLLANYYDNEYLTGVSISQIDNDINFDWGEGSPDASISVDTFSVSWEAQIQPEFTEEYTFYSATDDGVRLWVDGELIIDKWIDQSPTEWSGTTNLIGGNRYDIRMEYYENGGGALSKLSWSSPSVAKEIVPQSYFFVDSSSSVGEDLYTGEYWNTPSEMTSPQIPTSAPDLVRGDSQINFDWGDGSPDPIINNDHFIAVWTKTLNVSAGEYRINTTTDDGLKVYIDGNLIIDDWIDHGPTTTQSDINLDEGSHLLKVEYYENGGGAVAQFSIENITNIPSISDGDGLSARYYSNIDFTGNEITRIDSQISFDWGEGSPDPSIDSNTFSAVWSGKVEPNYTENYTFYSTTDDGVRLWIDGQLIINKWVNQAPQEWSASIDLIQGQKYDIVMEYFENGGGAMSNLSWSSSSQTKEIVPQSQLFSELIEQTKYSAKFWNVSDQVGEIVVPLGTPDLEREDVFVDFDWGYGSPNPLIDNDKFVAKWEKNDSFEDGTYRFSTTSDDGIRIYLDGVVLLDNWVDQSPTTMFVDSFVTAGDHTLRIEYYENGGGSVAKFDYEKL